MSTSLMANYARIGLTFERGEGSHLYTADGGVTSAIWISAAASA